MPSPSFPLISFWRIRWLIPPATETPEPAFCAITFPGPISLPLVPLIQMPPASFGRAAPDASRPILLATTVVLDAPPTTRRP
jgi:hypothetical protein